MGCEEGEDVSEFATRFKKVYKRVNPRKDTRDR